MFIFDAHTHFFSRAFYEFQARQARRPDVPKLLEKMQRHGIEVPAEDAIAHGKRIVDELDKYGVDRAVTFASIPDEMEIVGGAARASGGRLVPYAMVNPAAPESLERLERLQPECGFRGVVLFPAMNGYGIGDEIAAPALDLAARHGMVTFVHCGALKVPIRSLVGLEPDFPLDHAHPLDVATVAQARQDQAFVIPHFGAGFFDEFLRVGKACPNVYADTAGSNSWGLFQAPELSIKDLYEATLEFYGADRILFGSDTAGFPRGYRHDILSAQIEAMEMLGLGDSDRQAILGGNLQRLLSGR